jgi:hypothetical protein
MKYLLKLLFFACWICTEVLHAQAITQNLSLHAGFAYSEQDRRQFPGGNDITHLEISRHVDQELNIFLQKRLFRSLCFETHVGLGVSQFETTFRRPFKHSEINGGLTKELRYVRKYTVNKLILPISNAVFLTPKRLLYISFSAIPAFGFRKSVISTSGIRNQKWEVNFSSLELYPIIGLRLAEGVWLSTQYRIYNINRIDEVIFYHHFLYENGSGKLQQNYDTYNPVKLWFTLGYSLS